MADGSPLRFVTLLGSLRAGSYHAAVARTLPELAPNDVIITALGSVAEFPHYNADLQATPFPEEVLEMAQAIKTSDGVIIVTPEYNYSVPGALKTLWTGFRVSTPCRSPENLSLFKRDHLG